MSLDSSQASGPRASAPRSVVVTLPDEVDTVNVCQVREMLLGQVSDGVAVLVADATETTFFGASGITALISADRQARRAGAQFRLAASPPVQRILALTGADLLLDIYASLSEALDGRS